MTTFNSNETVEVQGFDGSFEVVAPSQVQWFNTETFQGFAQSAVNAATVDGVVSEAHWGKFFTDFFTVVCTEQKWDMPEFFTPFA